MALSHIYSHKVAFYKIYKTQYSEDIRPGDFELVSAGPIFLSRYEAFELAFYTYLRDIENFDD